jgi:hypothetical protein
MGFIDETGVLDTSRTLRESLEGLANSNGKTTGPAILAQDQEGARHTVGLEQELFDFSDILETRQRSLPANELSVVQLSPKIRSFFHRPATY